DGDYALIHRSAGSFIFIVARGETPIFFRQRPSEAGEEGHDQELRLSLSYYAEKLKGKGLSAVYLHDAAPGENLPAELLPVPPQPRLAGGRRGARRPEQLQGLGPGPGKPRPLEDHRRAEVLLDESLDEAREDPSAGSPRDAADAAFRGDRRDDHEHRPARQER